MSAILLLCVACQLIMVSIMLVAIYRLSSKSNVSGGVSDVAISIIIAARNEAENLKVKLPLVLSQDHARFEVVVVLDRCTDQSKRVVEELTQTHPELRYIECNYNDTVANKKRVIKEGINGASHEHLVFTDADCRPSNPKWLSHFAKHFSEGKNLIIGSGMFHPSNSIVNQLYRLDALFIALKYFTAAKMGFAYMAVGRSMGYTKTLFRNVNGFSAHEDLASGDDDLFVKSAASNAQIGLAPEALTLSQTPETWSAWKTQKIRHLTTGRRYRFLTLFILGLFELTDFISAIGLLVYFYHDFDPMLSTFFILFVFKTVILGYLVDLLGSKMWYDSKAFSLIFYQPLLTLVYPLFSILSVVDNPKDWKRTE